MEEQISKRVVGQDEAVRAVANAVRRARAGLQDPNRPIGSFLFLGPTGVGKTELTKAIAEFLFDDDQAMVRIDMSEFMEKHSVSRLIGAPPGYVGYDEGGVLTEAVRRRPYQVILFDEVEKAHPDVFNVLLQVLDDGRLTDGQGRTVDFKNTLIVLTSNLGSAHLAALRDGESAETVREQVMEEVRRAFRPEFLNRLDEILLFNRLSRAHMTDIVEIQLGRLRKLLADRKIELEFDSKALQWLANRGYDPVYGARPLKRVIQRSLQNPLATLILEGRIKDGDTVEVTRRERRAHRRRPARAERSRGRLRQPIKQKGATKSRRLRAAAFFCSVRQTSESRSGRSVALATCGGSFGFGLVSATTGAFLSCARYCRASPWKRAASLPPTVRAHGELLRQRIDLPAAAMELVVQVRAGRHAGRADEADHLALAHGDAGLDAGTEPRHVRVGRCRRRWCAAASRRGRSRRSARPWPPCRRRRRGSACPDGAAKSTPACKAL